MADEPLACRSHDPVMDEMRDPVAEMHFALGIARLDRQEACHGMDVAVPVLKRLAQHHIAAALPMDRAALGKAPQTLEEAQGAGDLPCVKLWIAAGEPTDIAV